MVSSRAVARSNGCPSSDRASQIRASARSTGRASCLITRNEKRTTPGPKSESPATTETSSPGRCSRDFSEPGPPAALDDRLCVPQPAATSVARTATKALACDAVFKDVRALLGHPTTPLACDAVFKPREIVRMTPRRPSLAPGPRRLHEVKIAAGLVTVEGAAAVERAAAVEHAGHRAAAIEHAGRLLSSRMRPILRLGETGQRPYSSGEGAEQEDESCLFHVFTSFRR